MATTTRQQAAIIKSLQQAPQRYDFFQAVRLLRGAAQNNKLTFTVDPSLSFAIAPITTISSQIPQQLSMSVNFIGLIGATGVLPDHYSEQLLQLLHDKNTSLRDFLDIFHHRLIELFYNSWEKSRWYLRYAEQDYKNVLPATLGLATENLAERNQVTDERLLFYAGLFSRQVPTAAGLNAILADYFNLPVSIKQFQGEWLSLPTADKTTIAVTNGQFNQLGASAVIGQRVWNIQNKFRVVIGPVDYQQFSSLLPNGTMLAALRALIRFYVGIEYSFDLQIILQATAVPYCKLGNQPKSLLGWNTWLKCQAFSRDAGEVIV